MNLLILESTCDETAAAVVDDQLRIRGSAVASQDELHGHYQGVVPEIAARAHVERILPIIDLTLRRAGVSLDLTRSMRSRLPTLRAWPVRWSWASWPQRLSAWSSIAP
jgi:N6-L-threonylcarbamoyladenine synthase